ncbi:MAG: tetratricopeptide repeat protein, partial [Snowella sp.]|nr:tetratricopeptide repeat protein [Snowella sp.]
MTDTDDKTKQNGKEKTHKENVEKAINKEEREVLPEGIVPLINHTQDKEASKVTSESVAKSHFMGGIWFLSNRKYKNAIDKFEAAIKIQQNYARAYYHCGIALACIEQYEKAINSFEEAINLFEEVSKIENDYFDADFRFDAYFWQSFIFLQIRDYQQAIKKNEVAIQIAKALGDNTKSEQAYLLWADILFKMKMYDDAVEKLNKAIEINHNCAPSYHNMTVYYWAQGNYKSAREKLKEAIAIYPKFIETEKGKQSQCKENGQEKIWLINRIDFNYLFYGNLVFSFWVYSGKNIDDANEIYLDGLRVDPNNIEILIALVQLYIQKQEQATTKISLQSPIDDSSIDWSKARQFYYKAVNLLKKSLDDDETSYKLRQLGTLYLTMEEIEEAEKYLKKALEKDIESLETNELPNRSKLRGITSLRLSHFVVRLHSTAPLRKLFLQIAASCG